MDRVNLSALTSLFVDVSEFRIHSIGLQRWQAISQHDELRSFIDYRNTSGSDLEKRRVTIAFDLISCW